jgi:uncharacterized protein
MKSIFLYIQIIFIVMLFCACESSLYHPHKKIYNIPTRINLDYEEISFKTHDDLELKGWLIKSTSKEKKGTILHFHGNAQNRSTHFYQLSWLTAYGFDLIIPDYRGYGDSEGSPNKKDIYQDSLVFVRDSINLHQHLKNNQFILWGQSLGGNIALRAASEFQDKINLLILDSTFLSYQKIAENVLKRNWITYLISPFSDFLIDDQFSGLEVVDQINIPTMILHGTNDTVIPSEFSNQIYERLKLAPKTLLFFDYAKHIQAFGQEEHRLLFIKNYEKFTNTKLIQETSP